MLKICISTSPKAQIKGNDFLLRPQQEWRSLVCPVFVNFPQQNTSPPDAKILQIEFDTEAKATRRAEYTQSLRKGKMLETDTSSKFFNSHRGCRETEWRVLILKKSKLYCIWILHCIVLGIKIADTKETIDLKSKFKYYVTYFFGFEFPAHLGKSV